MSEGTVKEVLAGSATWTIVHGDVRELLGSLSENSIDACVCDPPYHLTSASRNGSPRTNDPEKPFGRHSIGSRGFMGRVWDGGGVAFDPATWELVSHALKPGAHLMAFGGTRTVHRLMCAIEDAGFELRDSILAFVHGSGFPKSLNARFAIKEKRCDVEGRHYPSGMLPRGDKARAGDHVCRDTDESNQWNGYGSALKPSFEPIALARKPLDGTLAENLLKWGTGALNVDGCRVAHAGAADLAAHEAQVAAIKARGGSMDESWKNSSDLSGANEVNSKGRWPTNVLLVHHPDCKRVGATEVSANPTWDTPNRKTEPSAFTGKKVSRVRHANGRDGEPSAERRYDDKGSTNFAPLPGARRDATESVDVWECVDSCPVHQLNAQGGERTSGAWTGQPGGGLGSTNGTTHGERATVPQFREADSGLVSRYFPQFERTELDDITPFLYVCKPSRSETDAGLENFRPRSGGEATAREDGSYGTNSPRAGAGRTGGVRNVHPTKKAIDLIRWLARLAKPSTVAGVKPLALVPFSGSGSEMIACLLEGYRVIGIELNNSDEEPYVDIARARLHHIEGRVFIPRESLRAAEPPKQRSLFEMETGT